LLLLGTVALEAVLGQQWPDLVLKEFELVWRGATWFYR